MVGLGPEFAWAFELSAASTATKSISTGAYFSEYVGKAGAFGKIEGKSIIVSQKGLNIVKTHLAKFEDFDGNKMMFERLEKALANGEKLTGADASFYLHEVAESTMMAAGMEYKAAHEAAFAKYEVSEFSVYHPEVVQALSQWFNNSWKDF
jgi:hypothetical protein